MNDARAAVVVERILAATGLCSEDIASLPRAKQLQIVGQAMRLAYLTAYIKGSSDRNADGEAAA